MIWSCQNEIREEQWQEGGGGGGGGVIASKGFNAMRHLYALYN